VCEDSTDVFKVLIQPTQDIQHENTIGNINVEVGEGVDEALHLSTVVLDTEVTLNEAPKGGVNVEGMCFIVVEEVVLQGQLGVVSHVAALSSDVLQVREDGAVDPRLDDVVHPVPRQDADVRGVHQHVVRERVTPEGEQYIVAPLSIVRGGEVQRDRDDRTDVRYGGG
jgi:hypothetical protein